MKMKTKDKVIILINENPGIEITHLCTLTLLSKSNISILLKKLENNGLIEKQKIINKKNLKIHPTKRGKDIYLKIKLKSLLSINQN